LVNFDLKKKKRMIYFLLAIFKINIT